MAIHKTLDDVTAAAAVVRRAVVTAALVGLGVALLVGVALAGRLVRRLRALRDATLKVARLGPVVEVAPDNRGDEIGDLSRAFAVMQDRLREQEEARRTFVSTASHELRTPLTSLRLMLDLLHEELGGQDVDIPGARHQVHRARSLSDRLGSLAAQLLDLSRLDAGVPLRDEGIELREEARAVIAEFGARSEESGHPIELSGNGAVWAVGDPGAIAQVVRVLLDNALRFAPAGTAVDVTVVDGARPAVRVFDRGPGVPDDERDQIFERFRRGADTGGQGGFGLGLAIARELALRMDGDLVLVSADGGACFELRLLGPSGRAPELGWAGSHVSG
jgi:signal transduction histidine kinase